MKVKLRILLIVVVMLLCEVAYPQQGDGFSLQTEVDVANTFNIIDNAEEGFNGTLSVNYREGNIQLGVFYETFPNIEYESFGLIPYVVLNPEGKFNYLAGVTVGFINRPETFVPSLGVNGQLEYNLPKINNSGDNFYISLRSEYKTRSDIDRMMHYRRRDDGKRSTRFSGFMGIGLKF